MAFWRPTVAVRDRSPQDAVREVSGRLPDWLRGTCYWNGPGRFRRGDLRYRHWLDGDGMVTALRFDGGGRVHFA